jgi:putative transposase
VRCVSTGAFEADIFLAQVQSFFISRNMRPAERPRTGRLPRLPREWYQGNAYVYWTHSIHRRQTGWLDAGFHTAFREILLHTCARYRLACPFYCLMPDHWHLLLIGLCERSDQWVATRFLRKHVAPILAPVELQDRAHDHVLREDERGMEAVLARCIYTRANPVRAGLASDWNAWPYGGSLFPGYPELNGREEDWWERFWRCYNAYVKRECGGEG